MNRGETEAKKEKEKEGILRRKFEEKYVLSRQGVSQESILRCQVNTKSLRTIPILILHSVAQCFILMKL